MIQTSSGGLNQGMRKKEYGLMLIFIGTASILKKY